MGGTEKIKRGRSAAALGAAFVVALGLTACAGSSPATQSSSSVQGSGNVYNFDGKSAPAKEITLRYPDALVKSIEGGGRSLAVRSIKVTAEKAKEGSTLCAVRMEVEWAEGAQARISETPEEPPLIAGTTQEPRKEFDFLASSLMRPRTGVYPLEEWTGDPREDVNYADADFKNVVAVVSCAEAPKPDPNDPSYMRARKYAEVDIPILRASSETADAEQKTYVPGASLILGVSKDGDVTAQMDRAYGFKPDGKGGWEQTNKYWIESRDGGQSK